jgi:hypothetical protein
MNKVDTFFNGFYIYEHNGEYFIVYNGVKVSPAFVSLKDAQNNGWKYMKEQSDEI